MKNDTNLKMPLLGRLEPLNIETEARLSSNCSLIEGKFKLSSKNYLFTASLKNKKANTYSLTIETPTQNVTKEITRDKERITLFSPISLNYIPLRKEISYIFL